MTSEEIIIASAVHSWEQNVERADLSNVTVSDWAGKHAAVSDEDFAANPLRNRLSVLLSHTSHLSYHIGQTALAPK